MLLFPLLGCVIDNVAKRLNEDPFSDGEPEDDTGGIDTDDSGRPPDDTGVTTDDSGDTDTDTDTDTDPPAELCVTPGSVHPLSAGGQTSPYATLLTEDLDGGGAPDLLHEAWDGGRRGFALIRGEDIARGDTPRTRWFPVWSGTDQAAFSLGYAGDLDEDGQGELAVGEGGGQEAYLQVWDAAESDAPLATIGFARRASDTWAMPSETAGPDLDGDGVPELLVVTTSQEPGDHRAFVYGGAEIGGGGSFDEGDARLIVLAEDYTFGDPVATSDLDGDGMADILLNEYTRTGIEDTRLLTAELAADGGVLAYADLPVLVRYPDGSKTPLLVDLDDDGLAELFAPDLTSFDRVYGIAGGEVTAAAREGRTLGFSDAWVTLTGSGRPYLGGDIVPVTDGECETGLALSAHFANEVRLVSNATLRAGGTVVTDGTNVLRGGNWYSYVLAGGYDLDDDGTMDLVAADAAGDMSLYLAPWDALP